VAGPRGVSAGFGLSALGEVGQRIAVESLSDGFWCPALTTSRPRPAPDAPSPKGHTVLLADRTDLIRREIVQVDGRAHAIVGL
jgi:hypothetical protein